ncbi:MAG: hypothetical protein FD163_2406 [Hyphomonadaceae bacterium]|nr:MAG: hypothetical protein FD128_249 [Hyphomonadaceae bacterium]KAF0183289.1 MAG: hypothetical protein FD163_2406 [Hyphomonadaceae bacterium]
MPAVAISVFCWQNPEFFLSDFALPNDAVGNRLAYAISWMIIPAAMLLAGVFGASRRGFYGDAIEGTRSPKSHSLEINLRYNQNTVEQALIAVIVWAGLAIELPFEKLVIIPILAALFAVGRVTFWVGYLVNPMARTFGMTLTVFPTLIGIFWLLMNKFIG